MKIALLSFTFLTSVVLADPLVSYVGQPTRTITAGRTSVPIYPEARLSLPGGPAGGVPLTLTGAGLYWKSILGQHINAEVTMSYGEAGMPVDKSNPLPSFAAMHHRLIAIVAVRDISSDEIRSAFEDGLDANDVSTDAPGMADLLDALTFDLAAGETAFVVSGRDPVGDGHDFVLFQTASGSHRSEGPGLGMNLWSIWFGEPFDDGVAALKPQLLSGN